MQFIEHAKFRIKIAKCMKQLQTKTAEKQYPLEACRYALHDHVVYALAPP